MLQIKTGPFHPDLEQALVEDVRRLTSDDRIAPAAIIVPSESLRRRLAWLLCVEERLALLDVPILTFHQLALSLLHEANAPDATGLRTDFFFREIVRQLLRAPASELRWGNLAYMPGAWAAVWSTLKDLKDASVESERVLDAIEALESDASDARLAAPGLQSSGDRLDLHGLADILELYRQFRQRQDELLVWDRDDLAARAIEYVGVSSFLQRRRQMLYYGFYDLTQVQLDLFRAISHAYPTIVYFPLKAGDPAFEFAERFFTRYVCGLTSLPFESARRGRKQTQQRLGEQLAMPYESSTLTPSTRLISVAGALDEITLVAKDILGFVEERGMAFEDIGVTARLLAPYETILPRVFREHGIPFTSTLGFSLAAFPYVKAVRQLLDIRSSGLRSQTVMALLDSPFLRLSRLCPLRPGSVTPRLDLWRLAVDRLGITGGASAPVEDWQRLERFVSQGLPLREDLTREADAEAPGPRVPGEQIELLTHAISTLSEVLNEMPDSATWADYTTRLRTICEALLDSTIDGDALRTVEGWSETFEEALQELTALSQLGETVSLDDFVEAFQRLADQVRVPVGAAPGSQAGVQVMDAMAARGIPFRALYILGLNEKVFPRHIHEDAFLRDGARRFLEADLGFKIQEKLAGYQEEQLLFTLLCRSAREHLTLMCQRADEGGRLLVPSAYLEPLKQAAAATPLMVPRRFTAKLAGLCHYERGRLTPVELTTALLLDRRLPGQWLEQCRPHDYGLSRSISALREQERLDGPLGAFDGMLGELPHRWERLRTAGVSPSSLQEYATCPFRYFARHMLRLDPLSSPQAEGPVGPLELGMLAHDILRRCYTMLRDGGYFLQKDHAESSALEVLRRAAGETFSRFVSSNPIGRPFLWQLCQESLTAFLERIVRDDLAEMSAQGWEPVLFEIAVQGTLPEHTPGQGDTLPVHGRLDRVDWSASRNAYRIIDYKYKGGGAADTLDKNLALAAVRGHRLQPPLYVAMAQSGVSPLIPRAHADATDSISCDSLWFYYLAPQWEEPLMRVGFPGNAWVSSLKAPMLAAIGQSVDGIRAGRFFIFPESKRVCEACDFRLVCRRTSQAAVWRGRRDTNFIKPYRDLRRTVLPRNTED
jgi:ATP-dependent helicase/nuclease subunit B